MRTIDEDIDELEEAPVVDSWEKVSYINCPVEVHGEGKDQIVFLTIYAQLSLHCYLFVLEWYLRVSVRVYSMFLDYKNL